MRQSRKDIDQNTLLTSLMLYSPLAKLSNSLATDSVAQIDLADSSKVLETLTMCTIVYIERKQSKRVRGRIEKTSPSLSMN